MLGDKTDTFIDWYSLESKVVSSRRKGSRKPSANTIPSGQNIFDYTIYVRFFRQHVSGDNRYRFLVKSRVLNCREPNLTNIWLDHVPGRSDGAITTVGYSWTGEI
jgi:hypothetical protein